jgi:hypothetical protein
VVDEGGGGTVCKVDMSIGLSPFLQGEVGGEC